MKPIKQFIDSSMTPFFLTLSPKKSETSISYSSQLFLMGSCFVENIGQKLAYHKLRTSINPFGIVFHPVALENLLQRIVEQRKFNEDDIFYYNEQWHCFEVHSELSHSDQAHFLDTLNTQLKVSFEQLKQATHVVLTFGTAWGYIRKENEQLVANCHKIPQQHFNKQLSSVIDLESSFKRCFELIHQLNPKAQIITTISPVRHVKDGIIENNRSKAHLLAALHQSIESSALFSYYPAYELVMDCLRDYRFYKADLVHPNDLAIEYIWEHFMHSYLHERDTQKTLKQVGEIQRGLDHKPFNSQSEAHRKFTTSLLKKMKSLKSDYPFISF